MQRLALTKTILITELSNALGVTDLRVKEGTPLYCFVHNTALEIVKNSEEIEKLRLAVKGDTWHRVVVECESLFKCTDTAESPTLSNLPNLIRGLQGEINYLKERLSTAQILLAQETEQRKALLNLQDKDDWMSGVKIGSYLVNSLIFKKENEELKREITKLRESVQKEQKKNEIQQEWISTHNDDCGQ